MITVITQFKLPKPITKEEAKSIFLSTAPKYRDVAGLFRKCYTLSDDGTVVGGFYLWESREQAQAMFTEEWKVFVEGKYGTAPTLTYLDTLVVVDNVTGEIISED